MDFTSTQYKRLTLAGTVPLPSTMPQPGTIEMANAPDVETPIVCITQRDTSLRNIRRFVRLDDICAVAPAGDDGQVDWGDLQHVLTGDALRASLEKSEISGIAFVKEQAQVLMQVEMSMPACECIAAPRTAFTPSSFIPSHNPCCDI